MDTKISQQLLISTFYEFVEKHEQNEPLGIAGDARHCVLARAVRWLYPGVGHITVGSDELVVTLETGVVQEELEPKLARIVALFDTFDDIGESVHVTRAMWEAAGGSHVLGDVSHLDG